IDAQDGRLRELDPFACLLPGHTHHARLETVRGQWRYRCDGDAGFWGLAEVRAFIAYGRILRLSEIECARWRERLDYEAGLLSARGGNGGTAGGRAGSSDRADARGSSSRARDVT